METSKNSKSSLYLLVGDGRPKLELKTNAFLFSKSLAKATMVVRSSHSIIFYLSQ